MTALHSHRDFLQCVQERKRARQERKDATRSTLRRWDNYVEAEETVRNDYSENYECGSGGWPSRWILGAGDDELCEEFPALRRLMDLKITAVNEASSEGTRMSVSADVLRSPDSQHMTHSLNSILNQRFDVILLSPPSDSASWDWGMTEELPIRNLSADPSFVFLWVGSGNGDGLERGRECLAKWGFRRCEDLIFIKKNHAQGDDVDVTSSDSGLLTSQKEHCLMGIRGTVRRATDSWFVHCNVDVDAFLWDNSLEADAPKIPPYLYTVIENFCLGTRRLELFTDSSDSRRGWTSIGPRGKQPLLGAITPSEDQLRPVESRPLLPFNPEIETLRPKSPIRRTKRDDTMRSRVSIQDHLQRNPGIQGTPPPHMPPPWPTHDPYAHGQLLDPRLHAEWQQPHLYQQMYQYPQHARAWPEAQIAPGHWVDPKLQHYRSPPMQSYNNMPAYAYRREKPGYDV